MAEGPVNNGFITLHRQIRDHPYWQDPERLKAWVDILLMAAWKEHRRLVGIRQMTIERGEFVASERFLAKRWKWSRGKVRRFLEAAQDMNEIRTKNGTSDGTTYVVVNYSAYQDQRPSNGTSNGPPVVPAADQIEQRITKNNNTTPALRKIKLPDDWEPNGRHEQIASEEGVSLTRAAQMFRDHAAANGRKQIDWDRSFNNWLRSPYNGKREKSKGGHSSQDGLRKSVI